MQPTCEQRDAIETHDKNLIVVAGAGSGKTRVLVQRYLRLLEVNPDWRLSSVVAITFTREAAFDMRRQLREELEARARSSTDDLWARRLLELDSARIDTIHGLCADILRANAARAGIDPLFAVLDENESALLLDEAAQDQLATIEAPLSRLFAQYDAFIIESELRRLSLVNAELPPMPADPDALFCQWEGEWSEEVFKERTKLLESAEIPEAGPAPEEDKLAALIVQYLRYLDQIEGAEDAKEIARLMSECQAQGAVGNAGSARAWGGAEAKREAAQALRDLRARVKQALDAIGEPPGEIDRATAEMLPLWHGLLQHLRTTYRARKRQNAQLDFDDLERLAERLLADPAVQNRYRDAEFKHLLVDEFQDTNKAQWAIIKALADIMQGGSLFAVGDPKQSIYQFRGADVSVFNCVREQFAALESARELPLSTSFRSHQPLIAQFNALFATILTRDGDSQVQSYEVEFDRPMEAFRADPPDMPAIAIQLLDSDALDDGSADDMRRWEAYEIARRIQRMIAERRPVYDKKRATRPMKFRDIAVLFQSLTKLPLYEEVFKAQAIPFLTLSGRGYFDRQEVWDMLDLLRFLHNPADSLALATVLRSPIFAFSDDLLFALRLIRDPELDLREPAPLWRALQVAAVSPVPGMTEADRPALEHAVETLRSLLRLAGRASISGLLRRALAMTNYLAILTGLPDGDRRRGNVEKLLQLAEESGKTTLGKFSRYLEDLSTREAREGEAQLELGNAVRLMTVHASKGLEFPLVVLADASWERRATGGSPLTVDPQYGLSCSVYSAETNKYESGFAHRRSLNLQALKEEAERKRLLYVAATRAQDYLLISGSARRNKSGGWRPLGWMKLLAPALGLSDLKREPRQMLEFAGFPLEVVMPPAPPPRERLRQPASSAEAGWEREADPQTYPPLAPPLLKPLPPDSSKPHFRHISATQLALLGDWQQAKSAGQRQDLSRHFREDALSDLTPDDHDSRHESGQRSARLIGLIAHEALRYVDFSAAAETSDDVIRAIAWGHGLTDAEALRPVLAEVRGLLQTYRRSQTHCWIESARAAGLPVYTELPFVFRAEARIVHGVIDVLLRQPDHTWTIIDYKTSQVEAGAFVEHAKRFRLQLGVYAAAVQERLGLETPPSAFVHYLRANQLIELSSEECQRALDQLEAAIGDYMASDAHA